MAGTGEPRRAWPERVVDGGETTKYVLEGISLLQATRQVRRVQVDVIDLRMVASQSRISRTIRGSADHAASRMPITVAKSSANTAPTACCSAPEWTLWTVSTVGS